MLLKDINDDLKSDSNALVVSDLSVWVSEDKPWYRKRPVREKTVVIHSVNCAIQEGEFVALIGPSGAGKTTFLVSLAGKCNLGSSGTITIRGVNVNDIQKGMIEIIPQFEVFMETLTVAEHLYFMSEMKLANLDKNSKKSRVTTLSRDLMLFKHLDTNIKYLSGGEKRLLSLASSLLANPCTVIYDEPTTGLDSYNALLVINILKRLTCSGITVICSIHQPSSELFKEFNSLMLMAEGRLLFHGPLDDCRRLFESVNLKCPEKYNPAEFYLRSVSSQSQYNNIDIISNAFRNWPQNSQNKGQIMNLDPLSTQTRFISKPGWWRQVYLLLWRLSRSLRRSVKNIFIQLLLSVIASGIMISLSFVGISGTTQKGIQNMQGFLWMLTAEICYGMSYAAIYSFEDDLVLFKRESGMYHCSAFYFSTYLSHIPKCILWPIVFMFIACLSIEIPNVTTTVVVFTLVLMLTSVTSTGYGLCMGALFTSSKVINDIIPCVDLPLYIVSGMFLRVSSLPVYLTWFKFISQFYYCLDYLSNVYWRQIDVIDCENNTSNCVHNGIAVLVEHEYAMDYVFQDTVGLVGGILLWSIIGYLALKREERKGFIY